MTWEESIKAWIITIVIGTLVSQFISLPLIATRDDSFDFIMEYFLVWSLISLMLSCILSVPTLFILHLFIKHLLKIRLSLKRIRQRMTLIHIACGTLTFLFVLTIFGFGSIKFMSLYAIGYIGTGLIVWDNYLKKIATTTRKNGV